MNEIPHVKKALLSVRGLTVEFRVSRGLLRAVDDVDLDIYGGEVLGLAGESGCGKSVLAHAIIRQVDPNGYIKSGNILFGNMGDVMSYDEEELRQFRWKHVAIIFQGAQDSLNPVMQAGGHMMDTVLAHEKASKDDVITRSSGYLESVRLDADRVLGMYSHEISGGTKQRIIAAMSLLLKPKLLILDEPTSSLDMLTQKYFLKFMRDIHEELNITMLFITHDLASMAEIADRVAIMYLGKIVEIGKIQSIFHDPKHPYTSALLKAIPSIIGDVKDVKPLPRPIPDPVNPPLGCLFHPRCSFASNICSKVEPRLIDIGEGQLIACHLYANPPERSFTGGR